jgi:DNA ligase-1
MSDIRSFFGGKAAAPKLAAIEKAAPASKMLESTPAVETARENASTSSTASIDEQKTISGPIVNDTSALPSDVQNIITWKAGEPVPYLAMVETFEDISKVGGRLEKENLFARLFRAVIATTPADLDVIVYLASNEVSPVYEGKELGIGDSLLVKAVCAATGRNKAAVEEAYEKEGDLVRAESLL